MPKQFISEKSTRFYTESTSTSADFVILFGDEVDDLKTDKNKRRQVVYRGRTGWIKEDSLMDDHPLEMYFIDVGQGDSAFIVTPGGKTILIDGGLGNEAYQFLVWKYRLDLNNSKNAVIDLMVVSHADDDHIKGLTEIVKHNKIEVKQIIHSGIAKYKKGFHNSSLGEVDDPDDTDYLFTRHDSIEDLQNCELTATMKAWLDAIENEAGLSYMAVDSETGEIDLEDPAVTLTVLGPRLVDNPYVEGRAFPWLGSASKTINGHSVVLRLDFKDVSLLLPGDINEKGARHLMSREDFVAGANAHIFKAPHHGSHDFDLDFFNAVHPQVCVVSSGETVEPHKKNNDYGHPRANFLGSVGKASRSDEPLLFSTELVSLFIVDKDAEADDADDEVDPTDPNLLGQARRRFKKRLNGLINVRTDGKYIYCARRVDASYQFVTYKQKAKPRDPVDE